MKITIILILMLMLAIRGNSSSVNSIFVSPSGKTENPGTKEAPVNTIHQAIELAKQLKGDNNRLTIEIHLLPGEYHLEKTIKISPELNSLKIIGDNAKDVVVKGSKKLNLKWERIEKNIWTARVEEDVQFDQLFVNGVEQILARYPNYNKNGGHWQGHASDAISPERIKTWKNPVGAIVHAMHGSEWGDFHFKITGVDEKGEAILQGGFQNNRPAGLHKKYRMVENVFEELNSPGEWYFNSKEKKLYFWPPDNIDLKTAIVEIPVLKHLVEIIGSQSNPVEDVMIQHIRFEQTKRTFMEEYHPLLRSDWTIYRGGAILIEGAENCSISDCEFTGLGGNVIFVNKYNRTIQINGNHIHDCGASAICFVGDTSAVRSPSFQYREFVDFEKMDKNPGAKNELYPANCFVNNNLIHHIGRIEKQVAGVQISMAMDITISHNSIYDVPRAGINISEGSWGGHLLEYNDVFNTVLESGDHGSFNSWGRDRFWHPNRKTMDNLVAANPDMPNWDAIHTTIIRNNRFRCDHGWDIDLDDGSSNYYLYNNLCLNGGIKLREGFFRKVENNILVNNGFHPHVWFKNSGDIFRKNIVMTNHKDVRLQDWGEEIDYNLFPDGKALKKARENGTDKHSTYGNPLFKNPEAGDFSVEKNSPSLKLGFVNFPMDNFGVQKPELKTIAKRPKIPVLYIS